MRSLVGMVQVLMIVAMVVVFVHIAFGRRGLRHSKAVWGCLSRRPEMQIFLVIWTAVFLTDLAQTYIDDQSRHVVLALDYTPHIYLLEAKVVASLQRVLSWPPLTNLLTFFYLIVFPGLLFGAATIYDRRGDAPRVRMVGYVYAVNYVICLPFYFFFPVSEPWSYSPARVVPMIDLHSWPGLIDIVRPMSGLNNCFPSYHCSLTVSLVLLAWEAGPRRFARASLVCGMLIILSTVYLGFHWMSDLVAGITAGLLAYAISRWLVTQTSSARVQLPEVG